MSYPVTEQIISLDALEPSSQTATLRSALALSLALELPFRLQTLPLTPRQVGLVGAAAGIGDAWVEGLEEGATFLDFRPGRVGGGQRRLALGPAGHCADVLQVVLPALLRAPEPSELTLEGITHSGDAPAFEYFSHALLPLINRMGPRARAELVCPGFAAGGGSMRLSVQPVPELRPLSITQRGKVLNMGAEALVSKLPEGCADEQLNLIAASLPVHAGGLRRQAFEDCPDTGNAVALSVYAEHVTEVFTAIDVTGDDPARTARAVIDAAMRYLADELPLNRPLAEGLLIPLALSGKGRLLVPSPNASMRAVLDTVAAFTGKAVRGEMHGGDRQLLIYP